MFYQPKDGHGLPHNPFNAIVTPRPIGWISTRDGKGNDNLAPYSFFNAVSYEPPQVMFSSTSGKEDQEFGKDTVSNIKESGVFCVNVVDYALRDAMNVTSGSYPADVDEFEKAGLDKAECETIACSRVAAAPAALECKLSQIVKLEGSDNIVVFGVVTGVHMRDDCMQDGRFDLTKFRLLARLGYKDYTTIDSLLSITRPD